MEVVFQPLGKRTSVEQGMTLLDAALQAGIGLTAVCGGIGICGDCRIRVQGKGISLPSETELGHLEPSDLSTGLRLACQTQLTGDVDELVVEVPRESMTIPQRSQVEGREVFTDLHPAVQTHHIQAHEATIQDLRGDWERLQLPPGTSWVATPAALASLPHTLRENNWRAQMVTRRERIVTFLTPSEAPLGLAVDVGTTGLAAYLINFQDGRTLASTGSTNPQIRYGEDVMARLTYVGSQYDRVSQLQTTLVEELNQLTQQLCLQTGTNDNQIVDVVCVGNTAMHHLLFGLPVSQLGIAPYVPVTSGAVSASAAELGLRVSPGAEVYAPPLVAGFVGADHIAMLLAVDALEHSGITLFLDIGTNTEITLNAHGQLWTCSTASGPAFEGAHIHDGMRAGPGAIERLTWADGKPHWLTIDNMPAVGLCGSGVVDCVAAFRRENLVTPTGAFQRGASLVQRGPDGPWVELVAASETGHQRPIIISRADISEIQMAKGAIRAGMRLLLEQASLQEHHVDHVIIAGAFGSYLNLESARQIGMLPPLAEEQFTQVGNAAGMGAKQLLLNTGAREKARQIASHIRYVELTGHPHFTDRFSQAIRLLPNPWDDTEN